MSLKLFKITWPDANWDCYTAKLIVSESKELALKNCGNFNTLMFNEEPLEWEIDIECIGVPDEKYKEGDIVMTDYRSG